MRGRDERTSGHSVGPARGDGRRLKCAPCVAHPAAPAFTTGVAKSDAQKWPGPTWASPGMNNHLTYEFTEGSLVLRPFRPHSTPSPAEGTRAWGQSGLPGLSP